MAANTVVLTSSDGRVQALPLQLLLERGAILADRVNDEPIAESFGGVNQLMVPGLPARYFVRDIVAIDFEEREIVPVLPPFEDDGRDFTNRPNVSVRGSYVYRVGEAVRFEGYADDFDRDITAIEFSLDEGAHWTRYETKGARAGRWVWWTFDWEARCPGVYALWVRSVNEGGSVSPVAAVHTFEVVS